MTCTIRFRPVQQRARKRRQAGVFRYQCTHEHRASENWCIAARPPSATYQLGKFARRNKVLVGGVAATLVALVAGFGTALWQASEAASQRDAAVLAGQKEAQQRARADERAIAAEKAETRERGERERAESLRITAEQQRDKATAMVGFLEHMLSGVEPAMALGLDTSLIKKLLDEARQRIDDGELAHIPEAELQLRVTVAEMYREIADYPAAETVIEPAVATVQAAGAAHPEYARTMNQYGLLQEELGCWADAVESFELAVRSSSGRASVADHTLAAYLQNLGWCLNLLGKSEDALLYLLSALEMRTRSSADDPLAVARACRGVADCYLALADYGDALAHYDNALVILSGLDLEHPFMAEAFDGRGKCWRALGHPQLADLDVERAATIATRHFEELRSETLNSRLNKAAIMLGKGDAHGAIAHFEEVLKAQCVRFGNIDHPDIAATHSNIGSCYRRIGRSREALRHFEINLGILRRVFPNGHKRVAQALHNFASIVKDRDRSIAVASLQEALSIYGRVYQRPHPDVADTHAALAEVYLSMQDTASAIVHSRRAMEIRQQVFSQGDHPSIAKSQLQMARVLFKTNQVSDAFDCFEAAVLTMRTTPEPDQKQMHNALYNSAYCLYLLERPADARIYATDALRVGLTEFPQCDTAIRSTLELLARVHIALHDRMGAESAIGELGGCANLDECVLDQVLKLQEELRRAWNP